MAAMQTLRMLITSDSRFAQGRLPLCRQDSQMGVIARFDPVNLAALLASAGIGIMTVRETKAYIEQFYDPADPDRLIVPKEQ